MTTSRSRQGTDKSTPTATVGKSAAAISSIASSEGAGSSSSQEIKCPVCNEPFPDGKLVELHLNSTHYAADASTSPDSTNIFASIKNLLVSQKTGGGGVGGSSGGSMMISTSNNKGKAAMILQDVIQGKDIFELNENDPGLLLNGLSDLEYDEFINLPLHVKQGDLGHWIKKSHWQSGTDVCCIDGCGLALGLVNGRGNCYRYVYVEVEYLIISYQRCGSEVCNDHYRFQAKLSIMANFDPVNGIWARICLKCNGSKYGYRQTLGVLRIRTSSFKEMRSISVAKVLMEVNKTETRLQKVRVMIFFLSGVG